MNSAGKKGTLLMNRFIISSFVVLVVACGEDGGATGNGDSNNPPPIPALGAQMDRVGRAAVSTTLISPLASDPEKGTAKDAYNTAAPNTWSGFAPAIAASLAVYDSLDTICGNQVLAGPNPAAGRYDALAGALADDRLYVNMAASSCGQYLAVELDATGVATNGDCGGRTPEYDVVDVSYSAFAIGAVSGVGDGVDGDDRAISGTFPFLGAP